MIFLILGIGFKLIEISEEDLIFFIKKLICFFYILELL
jgi:hypothetical protein